MANLKGSSTRFFSYLLLLLCLYTSPIVSQTFFKGIEINIGYSTPKQDRRLFDAPFAVKYSKDSREKTRNDHQYDFYLCKSIKTKNDRCIVLPGIGYSHFRARYNWNYDGHYFGDGFQVIHYSDAYTYHMAFGQTTIGYKLTDQTRTSISFIIPLRFNVLVNKEMKADNNIDHYNRSKIELQNIEINPGLRLTIGRISSEVSYRIFNIQKIDHVIIDKDLFEDDNNPYLSRKFDDYNIRKFSFTVGYTL